MEYIATLVVAPHVRDWRGSKQCGSSVIQFDEASKAHVLHWTGAAAPPAVLRRGDALTECVLPLTGSLAHPAPPYRVLAVHGADASAAAFRLFLDSSRPRAAAPLDDDVLLYTALTEHAHAIHIESDDAADDGMVLLPPPPPAAHLSYLRPDQLRACARMQAIERQIVQARGGWHLQLGRRGDVSLDLRTGVVVSTAAAPAALVPLHCGVLTGARGSGKTAAALALALTAPPPPVEGPASAFAATHLIETRATLIVVPHHLVAWWKQELERAAPAAAAATMFICNPREAHLLTVDAVQRALLVVCSDKFVVRRRRAIEWVHKAAGIECGAASTPTARVLEYAAMRRVAKRTDHELLPPGVPLHLFYWARFIADEPMQWLPSCALMVHARWRWVLQAHLAHAHPTLFKPLLPVLGIAPEAWTPVLAASVAAACCVTMAGGAAAVPTEQRIEWVAMGREEQQRYECAVAAGWNTERLVRLCAGMPHDQVDATVAPPRLVQDALEHLGNLHVTLQQMLSGVCQEHPSMTPLLLQEVERAAFFERMRDTILAAEASSGGGCDEDEDEEDCCPVCLTERTTVITLCGHMFCWACMYKAFSGAARCPCPTCRYMLSAAHVVSLVRGGDGGGVSSSGGVTRRVAAKVQHLRTMCAQLATRREQCVVLAQWPALVKTLAAQLSEAGLDARACVGSVRERGTALAGFRAGTLRVLVMQLDECPGLSLVSAGAPPPTVVLFHALNHQQQQQQPGLIQAALRAAGGGVLHRLVAHGTVEAAS